MKKRGIIFFCAMLSLVFVGCSTTANWSQRSGFLDRYDNFVRSNDNDEIFIAYHKSKRIYDYSKFMVDPITVKLIPEARAYRMDKKSIQNIATTFRSDIIAALSENFTIVEEEGDGVIRVRIAITDIVRKGLGGTSKGILEAEFIETSTGDQVAATLTSDKGMVLRKWTSLLKNRLIFLRKATKTYQFK